MEDMNIKTHRKVDPNSVGEPTLIEDGVRSEVKLATSNRMAVDEMNLVHGGFTYGLADYAAMLAVNHPNVVLGGSECRFLAPVKVGDVMIAKARVEDEEGKRRDVSVEVYVNEKRVFTGSFKCYILEEHVLIS